MSSGEIKRLIRKVKDDIPLRYVVLTGGEPLLRADAPEIVSHIVDAGLQPIVITNALLLTGRLLRRLPEGIHFEITLLGHNAGLHDKLAGRRVFSRVVQNMARINRHRCYFTVGFVATRSNALDVLRTAELAIALGARAVMYNRVNLTSAMKAYASELVPPVEMLRQSLHLLQEAVRKYRVESVCSVPIPPCLVNISEYRLLHFGWCPRGGDNAYYTIGHNGLLRPCNHSSVVLGDLRTEGFAEIVSRKKCRAFWSAIPAECVACGHPLKDACGGGCTAASYEFYGSQKRMDPFCELTMGNSQ